MSSTALSPPGRAGHPLQGTGHRHLTAALEKIMLQDSPAADAFAAAAAIAKSFEQNVEAYL